MSPEFKRRLQIFWRKKSARVSFVFLSVLLLASVFAEGVSNSKPVVAYINNTLLFPAYVDYNRADVGLEGAGVVDYREVKDQMSFAVWPPLRWDPFENDEELEEMMSPPSARHPMGTDVAGRDVFARLLYGTRISFFFAFGVWIFTYIVGTVLGLLQGFFGGKVDIIGQRLVEVFASIPEFYLLLFLITILQPNIFILIVIASTFGWVSISQYMRAEALRNRSLPFTEAATSLGSSRRRILFKHILPNSLVPIITFSPFAIVAAIYGLAGLDLLGFGVPAPTPSWGELLDQARRNFQVAWWLAAFPSLFLFSTIVSLNLIGESLRSAFDPRTSV